MVLVVLAVLGGVIVLGLVAAGVIVARKRAATGAGGGGGLNAASRGGFARLSSGGGGPAPRARRAPSGLDGRTGPSIMDRLRSLMPQRKDRQYRSVVMEYAMQPMHESSGSDGYAPPELDGGLTI